MADAMGRTAPVTGGTRGIGAAVATALRYAGYAVAATYHGNDEAAEGFMAATGIPVFKWDVADDEACAAVFLASDDAGFITGSTRTVNGGQYLI